MDAVQYLRLLRRRWPFVVAAVLLAGVLGYATTPAQQEFASVRSFTATHTLLLATGVQSPPDFDRLQLFATTGAVPDAVAARLGSDEPGAVLASQVVISADATVGSVVISSSGEDGTRAAELANAFGEEIKAFLVRTDQQAQDDAIAAAEARVEDIADDVREVETRLATAGGDDSLLIAEQQAQVARYSTAFSTLLTLQEVPPAQSSLETLAEAVPVPTVSGGFTTPSSSGSRTLAAVLLALVLSLAAIVLVDRVDLRLRGRDRVEEETGLPVLAEIPRLEKAARKGRSVLMQTDPGGAAAEAYRTLRANLLLMPSAVPDDDAAAPAYGSRRAPQVVLVTSPSPSEGKTTSVVNLAAAMAETGRSVLVIDADLRRPQAHQFLGVTDGRGLSELLTSDDLPRLSDWARETSVPGVRLITAGRAGAPAAVLVARIGPIIAQARGLADVVILDCPPLLITSDATDLVPHVDTVLVAVKTGRTTGERARRASERLARLGVATAGVVLVASEEATRSDPYAAAMLEGAPSPSSRRGRRRSAARHEAPEPDRPGPVPGLLSPSAQDAPAPIEPAPPAATEPAPTEAAPDHTPEAADLGPSHDAPATRPHGRPAPAPRPQERP